MYFMKYTRNDLFPPPVEYQASPPCSFLGVLKLLFMWPFSPPGSRRGKEYYKVKEA